MRVVIGVDIGGTKIAAAPVAPDGRMVASPTRSPSDTRGETEFLEGLGQTLSEVIETARGAGYAVEAVGVGCAGTVSRDEGLVMESPNLPLRETPVAGFLADRLQLPIALDNDANVAALAESRVGAAADLRHVVMVTLGTGVGGGLVLGGRLYRGATGAAAELGHMVVAAGGRTCRCGRSGCLESYASGTALERTAVELARGKGSISGVQGWDSISHIAPAIPDPVDVSSLSSLVGEGGLSGEAIGALAMAGDAGARAAVEIVGVWLGVGAANLANIFEPEAIVVGGGLSSLGDLLLVPAQRVLRQTALAPSCDASLVMASLGSEAGVVGAGIMAWEESLGTRGRIGGPQGDQHAGA